MVDYTRATGSAGTLIIRDDGTWVSFWISVSNSQTFAYGKSWSGRVNSVNVGGTFDWSSGPATRMIGGSWRVDTTQDVTFAIGATGTQGLGGPTSFTQRITRPLPNAPSALTVSRVSDSQQNLNWSRQSTYTSVVVQRQANGGPWQQIGVAAGNAASFTDKSTSANGRYVYRVAGRAASGQSSWSGTATVFTTPAAPSGVTAVRSGDDIRVSASGVPPYASTFDVQDGGVTVATGVSLPWTHVAPNPAVPHAYRVRGVVGSLAGVWSAVSNTVQLISPPSPPSGLAPNGGVRASDEDVRFSWVHTPVDSSPQSEYELRYRPVGGAWATLAGASEQFREVELEVGAWEWQVRTKGAHPDWSPWSATATMEVIDRPGVAVVQPANVWDASILPIVWTWFQGQSRPQSAWEAELVNEAGQTVETRSGSGSTGTVTWAHRLTEGEWTVRVRAATGDVWSVWGTETFEVVFDPPAPPVLEGEWDESQGGVSLWISQGMTGAAVQEDGAWFAEFVSGGVE